MLGMCCIFYLNFGVEVGEQDGSFKELERGSSTGMEHFLNLASPLSPHGNWRKICIGPERSSSTDMEDFFHLGKVQKRSGWRAKYFVTNHGLFHFRNRKILSFVTVYSSVPFLGLNYSRHWQKDYNLILSYLLTQCICLLSFRGQSIHQPFQNYQNYPTAKMNVRVQFWLVGGVGGGGGRKFVAI